MTPVSFEFAAKTRQMNMRVSEGLLKAVKDSAAAQGITYQRFIRLALERAIQK